MQSFPCRKLKKNRKQLTNVLGFDEEIKSYVHRQFYIIWQIPRRHTQESLYVNSTVQKQMGFRKKWSVELLQSCLDEKWRADSMECYCYLWNIQDLLFNGKISNEKRIGVSFQDPIIPFEAMVEYHSISVRLKSLVDLFFFPCIYGTRGEDWKRKTWPRTLRDGQIWNSCKMNQCKGSVHVHEWRKIHIPNRRCNEKTFWRRSGSENIYLNPESSRAKRRTRTSSKRIRRVFFKSTSRLIVLWWGS